MTEQEIIMAANDAFKRRDAVAAELKAIDAEIGELVREYSLATKVWGFTALMLRQAVRARIGIAA